VVVGSAGDWLILDYACKQSAIAQWTFAVEDDVLSFFTSSMGDSHSAVTHLSKKIGHDLAKLRLIPKFPGEEFNLSGVSFPAARRRLSWDGS
jgi:hypothetical protein